MEQVPPHGDWKQPAHLGEEVRFRLFCHSPGIIQREGDGNVVFLDKEWKNLMNHYQEIQEENPGIADRKS